MLDFLEYVCVCECFFFTIFLHSDILYLFGGLFYFQLSLGICVLPCRQHYYRNKNTNNSSTLLWQKEAIDECDVSHKWLKCVCHLHLHQCNIMSWLKYLSATGAFLLKTRPGRRTCQVQSKNINIWRFGYWSLASFCQSRAELWFYLLIKTIK